MTITSIHPHPTPSRSRKPTYKELGAHHLETQVDAHGYTRQELADQLELKDGSYVTMVMSPHYPKSLLPPSHIPALARLCGLSPMHVLSLFVARLRDAPDSPMLMTEELLHLLFRSVVQAVDERRAAGAAPSVALASAPASSSASASTGAVHDC